MNVDDIIVASPSPTSINTALAGNRQLLPDVEEEEKEQPLTNKLLPRSIKEILTAKLIPSG